MLVQIKNDYFEQMGSRARARNIMSRFHNCLATRCWCGNAEKFFERKY